MSDTSQSQIPKDISPELESKIESFIEALKSEVLPDESILKRATPRWEYRKCAKYRNFPMSNGCLTCTYNAPSHYCQGPYLYLYWKEKGKLKKKYIGKYDNTQDYFMNKLEQYYSQYENLGNR